MGRNLWQLLLSFVLIPVSTELLSGFIGYAIWICRSSPYNSQKTDTPFSIFLIWFLQIIEKLSVSAPSGEARLKVLKEIAQEYNLNWDSSNTEAEFSRKHEDLLVQSELCSIYVFKVIRGSLIFWCYLVLRSYDQLIFCFVVVINAFKCIFMMSEFLGFDLALVNEQLPFYYSVAWLGIAH